MATSIVSGDVYEVRAYCVLGPQTSINVRHFVCTAAAGTGATDTAMLAAMAALFPPILKGLACPQATYRGLSIARVFPVLPLYAPRFSDTGQGVGTYGTDPLPTQTCGLITFYSTLPGRKGRGRMYLPFPAVEASALGLPVAAYTAGLNTAQAALTTAFTLGGGGDTSDMALCIYHKLLGTFDIVTSGVNRTNWATQRRRGSYGRVNPSPI